MSVLNTANTKISPVIDLMSNTVVLTLNQIAQANALNGWYLTVNSFSSATFNVGDTIYTNTFFNVTSGTVTAVNSNMVTIGSNYVGRFIGAQEFYTSSYASNVGYVQTADKFSESRSNGPPDISRYISKNVILAAGQDSEDMRAYLAAYRPANTDLYVYSRIRNASDQRPFTNQDWTKLREISPASLQSSTVNIDDQVELVYGFPQARELFGNDVSCRDYARYVIVPDSSEMNNNDFIYLKDNITDKYFNVREIVFVVNATAVVIDTPPSFTSTNCAMGVIPGIETPYSAFCYPRNNNIVRYCTPDDNVYDAYIQFSMKIVPVADSTALVPRVGDVRVIALQI
jgi:hypothetical protein